MLSAIVLAAALVTAPTGAAPRELLDTAIRHFDAIPSYRLTIRSRHDHGDIDVRYYYRQPGFVRIEFIHPHAGAVIVFNPGSGRVRLWPFGAGRFPELELSPDNAIIRSLSGIRVDRSDIGTLFRNIRALGEAGSAEMFGSETDAARDIRHFRVTGAPGRSVDGVHSSEVWLNARTLFPAKVVSRDLNGAIIETVLMEGATSDEAVPENLFDP